MNQSFRPSKEALAANVNSVAEIFGHIDHNLHAAMSEQQVLASAGSGDGKQDGWQQSRLFFNQAACQIDCRELSDNLESLLLRLEITSRLFSYLTKLGFYLKNEELQVLQQISADFSQEPQTTRAVELEKIQDLLKHLNCLDNQIEQAYKDYLFRALLDLFPDGLVEWTKTNELIIQEFEQMTTTYRENADFWQEKLSIAYNEGNEPSAERAWQHKHQFDLALSRLEEALIEHTEVAAVSKLMLERTDQTNQSNQPDQPGQTPGYITAFSR